MIRTNLFALAGLLVYAQAPAPPVPGIPVTDPIVIARCGTCHRDDGRGDLSRISWIRTTPEGWQEAIRRMVRLNGAQLSPEDARAIVKSLSASHGLAPEEAKPVMYMAERRIIDEVYPTPNMRSTCGSCHPFGRPMQWRRTKDEWQLLVNMHIGLYPDSEGAAFRRFGPPQPGQLQPAEEAVEFFGKNYGLESPEWSAWQARMRAPRLAGKWLVLAHGAGRGNYTGEINISAGATPDEFITRIRLTPVAGGPAVERAGRVAVYAGYSWRGRSMGTASDNRPDEIPAEMREVMWISPDATLGTGRWFWGAYDEFGFDVKLVRATGAPLLLATSRPRLRTGATAQQIRILGDNLPAQVVPADLDFGPGIAVKRIVARSASEITAEVDVAANAQPGKRDVAIGAAVLAGATAVYDRVDALKVIPETPIARLGGGSQHPKGYQQFEVMAYHRGSDNKPGTADDVELGPIDVSWSIEEFQEAFDDDDKEFVGSIDSRGLFTPAIDGPNPQRKHSANNHGNVWVVATAKDEKDKDGRPLSGRSYLVVAPPLYIIWDRGVE